MIFQGRGLGFSGSGADPCREQRQVPAEERAQVAFMIFATDEDGPFQGAEHVHGRVLLLAADQ